MLDQQDMNLLLEIMTTALQPVSDRLDELEQDVRSIKLQQESMMIPDIRTLGDGHLMQAEQIGRLNDAVTAVQDDLAIMKPILLSQRDELEAHDAVIQKLKAL